MLDSIRLPFFVAAAFMLLLALLAELAASDLLLQLSGEALRGETPGYAINFLALIDAILFYNIVWMLLGAVIPRGITGRAQGIVTFFVSLFGTLGAFFVLVLAALTLLVAMVSLLVAVPFGTIIYLGLWGHFARGTAAATLAMVMLLKLMFCLFLVFAQQGFLRMKGLMLLVGLSLGFTWLIAFLHALVPIFLVSIADIATALVIAVAGTLWLAVICVLSIIAVVKAILSLPRVG